MQILKATQKKTAKPLVFFVLFGSVREKASPKMLMKLSQAFKNLFFSGRFIE